MFAEITSIILLYWTDRTLMQIWEFKSKYCHKQASFISFFLH